MCQFGCAKQTRSQGAMYNHFREQHTAKELELWGINKDILDLGQIKDKLPEEFVKRQLSTYRTPQLKCELMDDMAAPIETTFAHPDDGSIALREPILCNPDPEGVQGLTSSGFYRKYGHVNRSKPGLIDGKIDGKVLCKKTFTSKEDQMEV